MSTPANPYAAPAGVEAAPIPVASGAIDGARLAAARERLARHCADPAALAADAAAAGPRLRLATRILLGLAILVLITAVGTALALGTPVAWTIGIILVILFSVIAISILVTDLRMVPRSAATTPAATVHGWMQACRQGRGGYLLATLGPLAREDEVGAPDLAPVITGGDRYLCGDPIALRAWTATFARAGGGQVRWLRSKPPQVVRQDGDYACVQMEVRATSWPQWANVLAIVLFFLVRLLGLVVGAILFYALRKRRTVTITKHLLRGGDGRWYLVGAEVDDGALVAG